MNNIRNIVTLFSKFPISSWIILIIIIIICFLGIFLENEGSQDDFSDNH